MGVTARLRSVRHDHLPIAPNLLDRRFDVDAPDKVWAGDITYIATDEGWLFLAVVIDLFSRQVIGWSLRSDMTRDLVIDALRMAWFRRHPDPQAGLIFHSDRGCQHARTGAEEPTVEVDLNRLLDAALEGSRGRGYDWQADLPAAAWVRGQPGVLGRLLDNLIDNAEQHGAAPFALSLLGSGDQESRWLMRVENSVGASIRTAKDSGRGCTCRRSMPKR